MCLTQDRYEYIKKMKNKQEDELKKPLGFTLNNKPLYKKDAEEIMKNKQKETLEEHDKHCGCGDSHTHKQEDDLKKPKLWKVIIGIIILLTFGIFIGFYIYNVYHTGQYDVYSISIYACHDGCSIATKNKTTGFLTNDTWECWNECKRYVQEVLK